MLEVVETPLNHLSWISLNGLHILSLRSMWLNLLLSAVFGPKGFERLQVFVKPSRDFFILLVVSILVIEIQFPYDIISIRRVFICAFVSPHQLSVVNWRRLRSFLFNFTIFPCSQSVALLILSSFAFNI